MCTANLKLFVGFASRGRAVATRSFLLRFLRLRYVSLRMTRNKKDLKHAAPSLTRSSQQRSCYLHTPFFKKTCAGKKVRFAGAFSLFNRRGAGLQGGRAIPRSFELWEMYGVSYIYFRKKRRYIGEEGKKMHFFLRKVVFPAGLRSEERRVGKECRS